MSCMAVIRRAVDLRIPSRETRADHVCFHPPTVLGVGGRGLEGVRRGCEGEGLIFLPELAAVRIELGWDRGWRWVVGSGWPRLLPSTIRVVVSSSQRYLFRISRRLSLFVSPPSCHPLDIVSARRHGREQPVQGSREPHDPLEGARIGCQVSGLCEHARFAIAWPAAGSGEERCGCKGETGGVIWRRGGGRGERGRFL